MLIIIKIFVFIIYVIAAALCAKCIFHMYKASAKVNKGWDAVIPIFTITCVAIIFVGIFYYLFTHF